MHEYMDKNSIKGWQLKENSQEFDGVKSWGTPMVVWPQKRNNELSSKNILSQNLDSLSFPTSGLVQKDLQNEFTIWKVNWSHYMTPTQSSCTIFAGKSLKITICLQCLFPPKWEIVDDPW